jgi:hypothetical protein
VAKKLAVELFNYEYVTTILYQLVLVLSIGASVHAIQYGIRFRMLLGQDPTDTILREVAAAHFQST